MNNFLCTTDTWSIWHTIPLKINWYWKYTFLLFTKPSELCNALLIYLHTSYNRSFKSVAYVDHFWTFIYKYNKTRSRAEEELLKSAFIIGNIWYFQDQLIEHRLDWRSHSFIHVISNENSPKIQHIHIYLHTLSTLRFK